MNEEKFKAVIEDLRSIYPIRLKPYPYPPKEGLIELKRKYKFLELEETISTKRHAEMVERFRGL